MATPSAKPFKKLSTNPRILHAPFYPADVRVGERVSATLTLDGSDEEYQLRVWRISPLGVELLVDKSDLPIKAGGRVDLSLRLGGQASRYRGMVVESRHKEAGRELLGIRWYQGADELPFIGDRRLGARFMCGTAFLPTGVAVNPARFNDFIHFRVKDVSADGMQVICSLRNKFLIPNMVLDSMISFPAIGQVKVNLQIARARIVSEDGREFLSLGVRMVEPSYQTTRTIGQYVLQFGPPTSVEDLRASGLNVESTAKAVDFGFVKTDEEYEQVLALRAMAYSQAGKLDVNAKPQDMSDIFDSRARILIARYRGEIIASLRLIYHEPDDQTEHEEYVQFPASFPRKDETVECTRVCTHPDYRGNDLLLGLFKHAVLAVLQSGRRWILGSATPKLLPMYTKIGFKATEVKYTHEALGAQEHIIFLGDARAALSGQGIGPITWNAIFSDIVDYLDTSMLVEHDTLVAARLAVYRMFRPLAMLAMRQMKRPRKNPKQLKGR